MFWLLVLITFTVTVIRFVSAEMKYNLHKMYLYHREQFLFGTRILLHTYFVGETTSKQNLLSLSSHSLTEHSLRSSTTTVKESYWWKKGVSQKPKTTQSRFHFSRKTLEKYLFFAKWLMGVIYWKKTDSHFVIQVKNVFKNKAVQENNNLHL